MNDAKADLRNLSYLHLKLPCKKSCSQAQQKIKW